jgi:hypothetical protein
VSQLYYFLAPASAASVMLSVSAVLGDPDVFVRLDSTVPTSSNAQYRNVDTAPSSVIVIPTNSSLFATCVNNTMRTMQGQAVCRVFIAVTGFAADAQYT